MHKERRRGVCDVQLSSIPKVLYPSILCAMSNLKFETSHIKLLESCLVLKLSASLIFVFKRSIDKIRRARNVIKEAKIRHHNIDISRTNNKELFFSWVDNFCIPLFVSKLMRLKSGPLEQTSSLERVKAENKIESRMQTSLMAEAIFLSGAFSESFKEGSFM